MSEKEEKPGDKNSTMESLREDIQRLTSMMTDVTSRLDGLSSTVSDLDGRLDNRLRTVSQDAAAIVKQEFDPQLTTVKDDLDTLRNRVTALETDVDKRLLRLEVDVAGLKSKVVDEPFDPKKSVIIFGLSQEPEEDIREVVTSLFTTTLGATVNVECT